MKKKIIFILSFCMLFSMALWADMPVPPPWLYGQWQTVAENEKGEQELLVIIFLPGDLLINGASIKDMIRDGYIIAFNQLISNGIYTIHLEYADGFWWEESFPMPVMTSVYIDKSTEEGAYSVMTYKFLPLGMSPSYNVPDDFK